MYCILPYALHYTHIRTYITWHTHTLYKQTSTYYVNTDMCTYVPIGLLLCCILHAKGPSCSNFLLFAIRSKFYNNTATSKLNPTVEQHIYFDTTTTKYHYAYTFQLTSQPYRN